MNAFFSAILLISALIPSKGWYAPEQPINVDVKTGGEASLILTDFTGKILEPKASADVAGDQTVNLRDVYAQVSSPGTYVLYVTKKGGVADSSYAPTEFFGTPLVIGVREDRRQGAPPGPMVVKVEPLRYAVMHTPHGAFTMTFYYDVAPNTSDSFLTLSEQGFYNGLTFHRILPGFVVQGGDPRGDGTGGPGFLIDAEFNRKPHKEGVLSMARNGDPLEGSGALPRPEFANSASSQFFICLDYNGTKALDNKYTAFGIVTDGMDAVKKLAAVPLADKRAGRPEQKQVIDKVEVKMVTSGENPYAGAFRPTPTEPPK